MVNFFFNTSSQYVPHILLDVWLPPVYNQPIRGLVLKSPDFPSPHSYQLPQCSSARVMLHATFHLHAGIVSGSSLFRSCASCHSHHGSYVPLPCVGEQTQLTCSHRLLWLSHSFHASATMIPKLWEELA